MSKYKNRNKKREDETLVDIIETKNSATSYIEDNQNTIFGAMLLAALIFGGFYAYKYLVKKPRAAEAMSQMYTAENYFQQDSFAKALQGGGEGVPGFLDIIDKYGSTSSGNTANMYAGLSYLHLGDFDGALGHLKAYKAKDELTKAWKYGAMGDCYSEKKDFAAALDAYQKAAANDNNEAAASYYTYKAALLNESQGNKDKAIKQFERIRSDFPNSPEAQDVDRHLARLGVQ